MSGPSTKCCLSFKWVSSLSSWAILEWSIGAKLLHSILHGTLLYTCSCRHLQTTRYFFMDISWLRWVATVLTWVGEGVVE